MNVRNFCFLVLFSIVSTPAFSTDSLQVNQEISEEQYQILWAQFRDSVEQTLKYETGLIQLKDGMATIDVPAGFKYLNAKDSDMIITDIWGNPPSEEGDKSLGLLIPENVSPLADSSFAINITYSEDGYVDDEDAKDIDYDELLETMQDDTDAANEMRAEMGYPTVQLVGWASQPFYDADSKKLHWAKELRFADYPDNTLNYNIRILGRKGYLQLNAIGEMYILDEVKSNIDPLLANVSFTEGNRYSDFNPSIDKVAAYGIGGLIAGKVLAKAGIFAKLGLLLAKFWKVILVALAALGGGIMKFFKKEDNTPANDTTA